MTQSGFYSLGARESPELPAGQRAVRFLIWKEPAFLTQVLTTPLSQPAPAPHRHAGFAALGGGRRSDGHCLRY